MLLDGSLHCTNTTCCRLPPEPGFSPFSRFSKPPKKRNGDLLSQEPGTFTVMRWNNEIYRKLRTDGREWIFLLRPESGSWRHRLPYYLEGIRKMPYFQDKFCEGILIPYKGLDHEPAANGIQPGLPARWRSRFPCRQALPCPWELLGHTLRDCLNITIALSPYDPGIEG